MKTGYKQTEVGVIPEDWEVACVLDVINSFQNGFAFASEGYVSSGIPIVTMVQIGLDGTFNFSEESVHFWPADTLPALRQFCLYCGDVIIAMTDVTPQKNLIGRMAEVTETGPLLLNQRVGLIRTNIEKINSYFLRSISNSSRWRNYARAVASLGVQANISTSDILKGCLPLPPLPEQRAIAGALSEVDALLGAQEALLAKKRDLKQAAMQQLLTGQKRLPSFTGEWQVKTLKEAMICLDELRIPMNEYERSTRRGDYPYCGANGVLDYVDSYVIDDDIILMAEDGGYFDEYEYRPIAYRISGKCWVNNHAHILKAKDGFDQGYLFYSLVHKNILPFLASGTRAKLNKSEMWKIEVFVPPSLPEQTAIAAVLSDMDAEIAALEAQRDKTRTLKQGMMQELLTGRIRLV